MRSETFLDGRITLLLGDCMDALPAIIKADAVITDPPYEAAMHKAKAKAKAKDRGQSLRTDGGPAIKGLNFDSIDPIRCEFAALAASHCQGWFIAFCSPEGIAPWRDAIEAVGMRYKRACFWYKPDSAPQLNGQGPAFAVEPFVTAWCGPGFSKWNGGGRRNMFPHLTNSPDRHGSHPTEKPISLMAELVGLFTDPGQVVCDPFMGSGTTGVACVKRGRRFVGIEKDPAYFDIACERIDFAARQPDMFGEAFTGEQTNILAGLEAAE